MALPTPVAPTLQVGAIASLPGIVGALVVVLVVLFVARFVVKVAWRIAVVALVVALVLWFLGILGPLGGLFGVGG